MKPGFSYDKGDTGKKYSAKYANMILQAQVRLKLIFHNIHPKSHISTTAIDVCALIYYILKGMKVDIACTIATEMMTITYGGRGTTPAPLAFPALIMGLIIKSKMVLPRAVHEKLKGPVNGASTSQAFVPPLEPHAEPQQAPHPAFDLPSYAQWQYQCHTHTWDLMEADN